MSLHFSDDQALVFDRAFYLCKYDNVEGDCDAEEHFLKRGWLEGHDPNPYFSTRWYLACHPDIGINPYLHYRDHGRRVGLLTTGYAPGGVDRDWYLARYDDLAPDTDPAVHYATQGWREGRDPNPDFSTQWYLACNPGIGMNPLVHYLQHGRAAGLLPSGYVAGGVDRDWYLSRYRDLPPGTDPASHYVTRGWHEGRDPNPGFSTSWYLASWPGLGMNPLVHYLQHGRAEGRRPKPSLSDTIRFDEWWSWKLTPVFTIIYATILHLDTTLLDEWQNLAIILAALVPGAVFVSLINDLSDREDDAQAGKRNGMTGRSPLAVAAALGCCLIAGGAFLLLWRGQPLLFSLYGTAWLIFSAYSLRPIRLKEHGLWGAVSDAAGSALLPTLLAVACIYEGRERPIEPLWFGTVGLWSLSVGMRGILGHQIDDYAHDALIGVTTSVLRHGESFARKLAGVFFAFEIVGLLVLLLQLASFALPLSLAAYLVFEFWKARTIGIALVVTVPKSNLKGPPPRHEIALHRYYQLYLPAIFLVLLCVRDFGSGGLAAALFALFCYVPARAELRMLKEVMLRHYYPVQPMFDRHRMS